MRLRMTASVLTLLCSWILWEKWTVQGTGETPQYLVEAVSESKSLEECRAAAAGFAKQRTAEFRNAYKESEYMAIEKNFVASLFDKRRNTFFMKYTYYCLPPTIDPYRDTH